MNLIVIFSFLALPFTFGALARDVDSSFVESAASSPNENIPGPGSSLYNPEANSAILRCFQGCEQEFGTPEWRACNECYYGISSSCHPGDTTASNNDSSFVESAVSGSSDLRLGTRSAIFRCTRSCDQRLELDSPEWENCYNCCYGISSRCNQGDTASSNIDSSFVESAVSDSIGKFPHDINPCNVICRELVGPDLSHQECVERYCPGAELQAEFDEKDNLEGEDTMATAKATENFARNIDSFCVPGLTCRNICDQKWKFSNHDEWLACYDCCSRQSPSSSHLGDATASDIVSSFVESAAYIRPPRFNPCHHMCEELVSPDLSFQQGIKQNCPRADLQAQISEKDNVEGEDDVTSTPETTRGSEPKSSLRGTPVLLG